MAEYEFDELGMAISYAVLNCTIADSGAVIEYVIPPGSEPVQLNSSSDSPQRGEVLYGPDGVTPLSALRTGSYKRGGKSVRIMSHESIPEEDFPIYDSWDRRAFEAFQKAKSASVEFDIYMGSRSNSERMIDTPMKNNTSHGIISTLESVDERDELESFKFTSEANVVTDDSVIIVETNDSSKVPFNDSDVVNDTESIPTNAFPTPPDNKQSVDENPDSNPPLPPITENKEEEEESAKSLQNNRTSDRSIPLVLADDDEDDEEEEEGSGFGISSPLKSMRLVTPAMSQDATSICEGVSNKNEEMSTKSNKPNNTEEEVADFFARKQSSMSSMEQAVADESNKDKNNIKVTDTNNNNNTANND